MADAHALRMRASSGPLRTRRELQRSLQDHESQLESLKLEVKRLGEENNTEGTIKCDLEQTLNERSSQVESLSAELKELRETEASQQEMIKGFAAQINKLKQSSNDDAGRIKTSEQFWSAKEKDYETL